MSVAYYITKEDGSRLITCLPVGLDQSDFIDITPIGSMYRVFLDTKTGKKHDCKEYHAKYVELLNSCQ